jgi:hypothetical protein
MRAALVDITNSGLPLFQNRSTLGEKLWEGAGYYPPVHLQVPAEGRSLTDDVHRLAVGGAPAASQNYAGNKADDAVSNPVSVESTVSGKARRAVRRRLGHRPEV